MFRLRDHLVFAVCITVISCLQWTPTLRDGQVIYACTGQDVTIPWLFSLSPGEEMVFMQWLYRGVTQEMVAMLSRGSFVPLLAFTRRVQHGSSGGLIISHVGPDDSGNFTVEVTTVASSGEVTTYNHTVALEVSDGLPTTDGQLHVTQQPDVILDTSSQQWSIVLTCGNFTSVDQPPFPVEWEMASGQVRVSSDYREGQYALHVASPVVGGTYVCRAPGQRAAAACAQGSERPAEAEVKVDSLETNTLLILAELKDLKRTNSEQAEVIDSLINQTRIQKDVIGQLETQLQSQQDVSARLEAQLQSQQDQIDFLHNTSDPCSPANHTRIDDYMRDVSYGDGSVCDKYLTPGWYRFLVNGTNAVMPTSCVQRYHCNTDRAIWLDLQGESLPSTPGTEITVRGCSSWTSGCCQYQTQPVTVRQCGGYFVYRHRGVSTCSDAYCVQADH